MQGDEDILTVALDAGAVGLRLDRALAEALPNLSRERVKTLIKGGRVADDSGTVLWDPAAKAAAPATLRLRLPIPAPAHNAPQDLDLVVAREDAPLTVVDKPAGMGGHPPAGRTEAPRVGQAGDSTCGYRWAAWNL